MYAAVQIFGSLLILGPFVGVALRRLSPEGSVYLALNAVGSLVLLATALIRSEWGFVLLEGVWAVVSLFSLARKAARRTVTSAG
jgi:fucose permease